MADVWWQVLGTNHGSIQGLLSTLKSQSWAEGKGPVLGPTGRTISSGGSPVHLCVGPSSLEWWVPSLPTVPTSGALSRGTERPHQVLEGIVKNWKSGLPLGERDQSRRIPLPPDPWSELLGFGAVTNTPVSSPGVSLNCCEHAAPWVTPAAEMIWSVLVLEARSLNGDNRAGSL